MKPCRTLILLTPSVFLGDDYAGDFQIMLEWVRFNLRERVQVVMAALPLL